FAGDVDRFGQAQFEATEGRGVQTVAEPAGRGWLRGSTQDGRGRAACDQKLPSGCHEDMIMKCMRGAVVVAWMLSAIPAVGQTPAPLGKLVEIGGHRMHLYCTGSGSPTVMLLGAGFSFDWALVQPEVARFTNICTYDVSGTAWSDPAPGGRMT